MAKQFNVGLFPMCADILHAGHIMALMEAKDKCDHLCVALNTHPDGKDPVQSVWERWTQLKALKYVDMMIPYQGRADLEFIASTMDYDVRFLGADYRGKDWDGKEQETKRGIPPYFLERDHGLSSTELKERIVRDSMFRVKVPDLKMPEIKASDIGKAFDDIAKSLRGI